MPLKQTLPLSTKYKEASKSFQPNPLTISLCGSDSTPPAPFANLKKKERRKEKKKDETSHRKLM
jgi:hypothetical protein